MVSSRLNYGWDDPTFVSYLDSDDMSYEQVQLSPQQLQLASEMWGLDEATAKAYVYHHQLTPEDIAMIEMSFIGKKSAESEYSLAPNYDAELSSVRKKYLPGLNDEQWGRL